jgi:hypothetical protein
MPKWAASGDSQSRNGRLWTVRRATTTEVAGYLRVAFSANRPESLAWAFQLAFVRLVPWFVLASASAGLLSELLNLPALGLAALGIMQLLALLVAALVVLSYLGLGTRFRHRGQSQLPVFGYHGVSIIGNLAVRRIGPRWRGDTTYAVTTTPRPPRTRAGRIAHRIFWGAPERHTWQTNDHWPT